MREPETAALTALPASDPRERKVYHFEMNGTRRAVTAVARGLFSLLMKMRVRGLENYPLEGPVIVAGNHVTTFDVFPMQLALPRPIFFMGKASLFKNPLMDWLLRTLGGFPVFRGERDAWAIEHARKVLRYGQTLGMFPEGTRSRGKGLAVAKTGAARLAIELGVPIVPMAVVGSDRFFRHFPRRAPVNIRILEPIVPGPDETPLALTDRLMFTLAEALPPEMRGVYAERPKGF